MRFAAMIIGILGGIIALFGVGFAMFAGGIVSATGAPRGGHIVVLGLIALAFAVLGIVAGGLSLLRPKLAGILMIISAIGGCFAIIWAYIAGGILLFIGGIFALLGSREITARPIQAAT